MKLIDLFPEDELFAQQLAEGPIAQGFKKAALGGAIAANLGLGALGYNAYKQYNPSMSAATPAVSQQTKTNAAKDTASDPRGAASVKGKTASADTGVDVKTATADTPRPKPRPADLAVPTKPHANFPEELLQQAAVDPDVRVQTFVNVMLPYIERQNRGIEAVRNKLLGFKNRLSNSRPIMREDREYIAALSKRYDAEDLDDLLTKIDIIPPSLALAQAALESGWGQDDIARQANVFYGQKAWDDKDSIPGSMGERYRAFETPAHSVQGYMFNLNTHSAYEEFRKLRAELRAQDETPTGIALAPTLIKYSTLKQEYPKKVIKLIKGRDLDQYDK
jgi:Bax protein